MCGGRLGRRAGGCGRGGAGADWLVDRPGVPSLDAIWSVSRSVTPREGIHVLFQLFIYFGRISSNMKSLSST